MKNLSEIARITDPLADRAMAAALPTADPATRAQIVALLLRRGSTDGLAGLIEHFDGLSEADRERVLASASQLGEACQRVADAGSARGRLNMVDIVVQGPLPRLGYLLAGQLKSDEGQLTRAAAAGLLRLVRRHVAAAPVGARQGAGPGRHEIVEGLRSATAEACALFERHRRRDVLLAAVCFAPDGGERMARHTVHPEGAATAALAGLIRQGEDPTVRRKMLAMACVEGWAPSVTAAFRQGAAMEGLELVLGEGHLLAVPEVRRAVRAANQGDRLVPEAATAAEWALPPHRASARGHGRAGSDGHARRFLGRWLDAVEAGEEAGTTLMTSLATDDRRAVRLGAVRWLCRRDGERASELLATLSFDPDPSIARIAVRRLIARRWTGLGRLMLRLIASEHEGVRRIAERHVAPIGFDRFWRNWQHLNGEARVRAGRALLRIDGAFGRKLSGKLRSRSPAERLQAVMAARALGQVDYHESELRALASDADGRVASAAVKALGDARAGGSSEAAIAAALDHQDDRVRSNAIEALERLRRATAYAGKLLAIGEGGPNRSRATAIKALLSMPMDEALPKLRRMLRDEDERHRLSALWVVERMGLGSVVNEVAGLARSDPSGRLRHRAMRTLRTMARRSADAASRASSASSTSSPPSDSPAPAAAAGDPPSDGDATREGAER